MVQFHTVFNVHYYKFQKAYVILKMKKVQVGRMQGVKKRVQTSIRKKRRNEKEKTVNFQTYVFLASSKLFS